MLLKKENAIKINKKHIIQNNMVQKNTNDIYFISHNKYLAALRFTHSETSHFFSLKYEYKYFIIMLLKQNCKVQYNKATSKK